MTNVCENGNAKKILIVSYSYSGNTHRIAKEIRMAVGGDSYTIFPWQPYPMEFSELLRQVKEEVKTKYRPRLLPVNVVSANYDIIFAGSPNWCGTIAPPLYSWLYYSKLDGKIILPFVSHCGGTQGDIQKDISRLCPKSEVRETLYVLDSTLDDGRTFPDLLARWLEKNQIPHKKKRKENDDKRLV